jgi:methionyl-tRNA formyltransferase
MRILLFGDGPWAADSLHRLARDGHDLAGVVLRERPSDGTLEAAARARGVRVLRPARCNTPAFVETVAALAPELGLSIAYDQILRRPLLDLPPHGILNVHAGKLPRYRGRNVINWAILNGEEEIGITVHMVDEGIDSGDIVLQRTLPIGWTDGYGDVLARVVAAIPDLVSEAVRGVAAGTLVRTPQDPAQATYVGGRGEGDEWLDWSDTSRNLHNKIRAITRPGPGARTLLGTQEIIIWRAYYDPAWPTYLATPGQVVGREADGSAVVKTGDSTLRVQEVQPTGGTSGPPFWRIGTRLGLDLAATMTALVRRIQTLEELATQEATHAPR